LPRKINLLVLTILAVLFLSACVNQPQANFESIDALIQEGIIAPFDPEELQPEEFNLVQVGHGDMVINLDLGVSLEFPRTYHPNFESELRVGLGNMTTTVFDYGWFSGISIRQGHVVTEGDFLASLTFDIPEPIAISLHALELERRNFEEDFIRDRQNRLQEIENLRIEMDIAPEGEWELIALRLERAELAYRQFIINTENRRESFADRQEHIMTPIEEERIYAPVSGVVIRTTQHFGSGFFREIIPQNTGAGGNFGRGIASIVDREYKHFVLEAPLYALLYGDIITVHRQGGEAYFYAQIATDPLTENVVREGLHRARLMPLPGEFERFMEEVEEELGANFDPENPYSNISLRFRTTIPRGTDIIYLDRRAIIEDNQRTFVLIYEDGTVGRRYISTGPNGNVGPLPVTQILAGLNPGQWVVIP